MNEKNHSIANARKATKNGKIDDCLSSGFCTVYIKN